MTTVPAGEMGAVRATLAADRWRRAVGWLRNHVPELLCLAAGLLLRLSMLRRFDPGWGYDAGVYWEIVQWWLDHWTFPPRDRFICAHHPPLYFLVVALLVKLGVTRQQVTLFPILCGTTRLALIWAGLERYLPRRRWARVFALALAAVLPVSVHVDGCLYPEPVNGMFAAAVMLALPGAFRAEGRARWRAAAWVGVFLGFQMLTKISALTIVATIGLTLLLEAYSGRERLRTPAGRLAMLRGLAPWSLVLLLPALMSGWYFARNLGPYHKLFLTGYDTTEKGYMTDLVKTPVLDRRKLGFPLLWDDAIYRFPYNPSGLGESPRFFPVAMASSFSDYYNQSFSGLEPFTPGPIRSTGHILTKELVSTARFSVLGGTVLLAAAFVAWLASLARTLRARDWGIVCLMLVPPVMTAFAFYTACKYPFDSGGVIKGAYMTYG
ncbi:MAG: ArnT family glycosyltransferase, partial [Polyangiaceae bacterium]